MKTVVSKSGRKYTKTAKGWKEVSKGYFNIGQRRKKTPSLSPYRSDVLAARARLVAKAKGSRKKIAALLRRFRAADRNAS